MHPDEVDTDADLVRRLLRAQYPQWADLPIERVASSGTVNTTYRVGTEAAVRLPRLASGVEPLGREWRWLPLLAPRLPLAIPHPLAMGEPAEGFPYPWAVYEWIEGTDAIAARVDDLGQAARDIADFIRALQSIDTHDGPHPTRGRGTPLATVDAATRRSIEASRNLVEVDAVTAAWDAALRIPEWDRDPVWFHGDIQSWNLIVRDRRIAAVIDFGGIAVGDPACELVVAWEFLDTASRQVLRAALDVDEATWERGRGWGLCTALWALPYYLETNPMMAQQARRKIAAVLEDR